jgi:L-gulonolactone oxidase
MSYLKAIIVLLSVVSNLLAHDSLQNWAGNQLCNPQRILYPTSKQELIDIIKKASRENNRMCAIGMSHSFSDVASSNDYVISLQHLNHILYVDTALNQVCVQGGILLNDFNEQIAQYGLALTNLPAISALSLAGALCTATHGTGHSGTLSSFIVQIELIDVQGECHVLSLHQDPEIFKASCVSLGALGIIYSITMQCEPLFALECTNMKMSLQEMLLQYQQLNEESDYFQFHWRLIDDSVTIDCWNRIPVNTTSSSSPEKKISYKVLPWDTSTELGFACEIAIPVIFLPQAIDTIKQLVDTWNFPEKMLAEVTCRFVKADKNSYLSPSIDYDVVYINIGTDIDTKYFDFFKCFEKAMYTFKGRPHWGKINFLDYEKIFELYGENFIKFLHIKKQLDPFNRCSNFFMDRIMRQVLAH